MLPHAHPGRRKDGHGPASGCTNPPRRRNGERQMEFPTIAQTQLALIFALGVMLGAVAVIL